MPNTNDTLLRAFAGVLLGYVALASSNVLFPRLIHTAFTFDDLFQPACYAPTPLFIALILSFAAGASLIAGYLCRTIAVNRKPVFVFAAIIGIFSFFAAMIALSVPNDSPPPRVDGQSMAVVSGQMVAQQPVWLKLAQPVLLTAGILVGGSRRRLKSHT